MRAAVLLSFDLPSTEDAAGVLSAIDPPHLPHFAGLARITVNPWASAMERYLDEDGTILTEDQVDIVRWLIGFWSGTYPDDLRASTPPSRDAIITLAMELEK